MTRRSIARGWTVTGLWPAVGGIGVALLGHLLAIAAVFGVARLMGGGHSDVDLDSGGRFAVAYAALCTYTTMQVFLLIGVGVMSAYGSRGWKLGLAAGWCGGWMLLAGGLYLLLHNA